MENVRRVVIQSASEIFFPIFFAEVKIEVSETSECLVSSMWQCAYS